MNSSGLQESNNRLLWTGYDHVTEHVSNRPVGIAREIVVLVDWENPTNNLFLIDRFSFKETQYIIEPALRFQWTSNPDTGLFEIEGLGIFEDILVYGESLRQAKDILCDGIIPMLWEDCVNDNDNCLTARARTMVMELRSRVKAL